MTMLILEVRFMKIKLNSKQERFVETQVNSGKFATVDEVVNLALQLLEKMGGGVRTLDRGDSRKG
jgi:putative addiction module CopG family antidote